MLAKRFAFILLSTALIVPALPGCSTKSGGTYTPDETGAVMDISRALVIGQGGKGIRVGQEYKLVQLGREIIDTYTDEYIALEEIVVGRVKIISVQSKKSVAKILKSTNDVVAATAQRALTHRPIHSRGSAGISRTFKEAEKEAEEEFEKMESKNEKDW